MNKLLYILPILILVGTSIFILNGQKPELQNLVPVPIGQFVDCYQHIQQQQQNSCKQSSDYKQVLSKFEDITTPGNTDAPISCSQLATYLQTSSQTDFINQDNHFYDCFVSEQARQIANTNECFFKNTYAPIYLRCGGFYIYAFPPYTEFNINS